MLSTHIHLYSYILTLTVIHTQRLKFDSINAQESGLLISPNEAFTNRQRVWNDSNNLLEKFIQNGVGEIDRESVNQAKMSITPLSTQALLTELDEHQLLIHKSIVALASTQFGTRLWLV